jgi:aromatic-L-amino-acid/L-tryptophan decarboxylase
MRDAFSLVPPYLRTDGSTTGVGGPPWWSEYGFQQTRGFRALKVWMALKQVGADGYARRIEESIELARYLHRRIVTTPELEALAPPGLSIVCFRYRPPALAGDGARLDAVNQALLERIQLGGEAFLSGTTVRGAFALRACIVNHGTSTADLDSLIELLAREGPHSL